MSIPTCECWKFHSQLGKNFRQIYITRAECEKAINPKKVWDKMNEQIPTLRQEIKGLQRSIKNITHNYNLAIAQHVELRKQIKELEAKHERTIGRSEDI